MCSGVCVCDALCTRASVHRADQHMLNLLFFKDFCAVYLFVSNCDGDDGEGKARMREEEVG